MVFCPWMPQAGPNPQAHPPLRMWPTPIWLRPHSGAPSRELMARTVLEDAIEKLKERYDYIILDTAPIAIVTDTAIALSLIHI